MESDSHAKNKHPQDTNTNQLLQELNEGFSNQTLVEDQCIPPPRNGDDIPSAQSAIPSSRLLNVAPEIRRKILYYVLCPPDTCYCYHGFGRIMELRWGDVGSIGREPIACPQGVVTAASLQGLPTVLAVNKQLQEETLDVFYEEVTVEITMCDDYLVPHHWRSRKRMIDISRLKKILYPIHLQPACPTRSGFPPMLISAQKQGLSTTVQGAHLRVLQTLLAENDLRRELEVRLYITWKMIDTIDSVKGVENLIFPIFELNNLHSLQFSIRDFIEREVAVNQAKNAILAIIDMAGKWRPDQGRQITLQILNTYSESGKKSPHATVRDSSWTRLHQAAIDGNEAEVRSSLDAEVDIEARDMNGFTALHYAAGEGHEVVAKLLVEAGADIHAKGTKGWRPLHLAAGKGHEAVVRLLIRRGANLETRDNLFGSTALHEAARNRREGVVRLLLEHRGISINARDYESRTPLLKAIEMGNQGIANLLLSQKDVDADARDDYGRSPLSLAAEKGDEALVRLLLEREDVEVESKDKGGRTPLSWARGWDLAGLSIRRQLLEHKSVSMENIPTLNAVFELGNICRKNGMFDEAEKMYKRAIEGKKKVAGLKHLSTLDSIHHLGNFYANEGRSAEAEQMLENVLKAYERTLGPEHPATVDVVHNLGHLNRLQGKLSDAEKLLQRAVNAREKSHGSDHSLTMRAIYDLGLVYQDQGRLRQAEEMYQKALLGLPSNLRISNIRKFDSYRVEPNPGFEI